MDHINFGNLLPKIMDVETRIITNVATKEFPKGDYAFAELYCTDKKCDCRRVMIMVLHFGENQGFEQVASFSYGWEPLSFYRNWSMGLDEQAVIDFKGPELQPFHVQASYAELLLAIFKDTLQQDPAYAKRLERHYKMFKWKLGMKFPKSLHFDPTIACPCKSGKSFAACCGKRSSHLRRR